MNKLVTSGHYALETQKAQVWRVNSPERMDGSKASIFAEQIARLHAEFAPQLVRLAWAIVRDWELSADAVQETFTLLAQKFDTIEEVHRRGWLFKTVQYQALNLRRSQQRSAQLVDRLREQPATYTTQSYADTSEKTEELERLRAAIAGLPVDQQRVVQLRLNEELGFGEIASKLNVPLGTVLSRMRLALEKLRRKMPYDEHP